MPHSSFRRQVRDVCAEVDRLYEAEFGHSLRPDLRDYGRSGRIYRTDSRSSRHEGRDSSREWETSRYGNSNAVPSPGYASTSQTFPDSTAGSFGYAGTPSYSSEAASSTPGTHNATVRPPCWDMIPYQDPNARRSPSIASETTLVIDPSAPSSSQLQSFASEYYMPPSNSSRDSTARQISRSGPRRSSHSSRSQRREATTSSSRRSQATGSRGRRRDQDYSYESPTDTSTFAYADTYYIYSDPYETTHVSFTY
jgi:hypothetical protein